MADNNTGLEKRILAAFCKSRQDYESVRAEIGSTTFSAIATTLKEILEDYYSRDPNAGHCPPEVLAERFRARGGSEKLAASIEAYAKSIDLHASVPNVLADVRLARRNAIGNRISGALANHNHSPQLDSLIEEYRALGAPSVVQASSDPGDDRDIFNAIGSKELVDTHFSSAATYSFPFPTLNSMCDGGARGGHHILIFARPEIGKTLLALRIVRSLLPSSRVLYVGNEDPMADITLRLFSGLVGKTTTEVRGNPGRFDDLAFQHGYANFIGAALSPGSFPDIETLVDEFQPSVVVLDQLRNLNVNDENRVTGLEKAAQGARNLAKSKGLLVLSLTQAGESAEGKSHLDLSDIDFSKTGIPGAVDLAIGLGGTREDINHGFRTINISKNKLGGEHGSFQVEIDTKRGQIKEV